MDLDWAVPWTTAAAINVIFLAVATFVVVAVPVVYGCRANFRDPLARALFAGTGATGLAFAITLAAIVGYHAGLNVNLDMWNWIARGTYLAVALGKATLLVALLRAQREQKRLVRQIHRESHDDAA